jgi:flavorubredoxin
MRSSAVEPRVYVEKVAGDLYLLRVDDVRVEFFEAMWEVPERITYNAYVLAGDEPVLFDGWKREYSDLFLQALGEVLDPRNLKTVVVHHAEPDHSGTVPAVAEAAPRAVFVGHPLAGRILRSHFRVERFKPVGDGERLSACGRTLRFVYTPWLHWPDTIVTYVEEDGVLLSCDVFGSYSLPPLFDDQADRSQLSKAIRKYTVTVIGHYIDHVGKGIEKLRSLGITPRVIAPGHGPVYRSEPGWVVEEYLRVASGRWEPGKAVIAYVSMYGAVEEAVNAAKRALEGKGFRVYVFGFTDKARPPVSEVLAEASDAELLVLGAPAYEANAHPLMVHVARLIGEKLPHRRGMPVILLSSYGWGPAGKALAELLKNYGFSNLYTFEFEGAPRESELEEALKSIVGKGAS